MTATDETSDDDLDSIAQPRRNVASSANPPTKAPAKTVEHIDLVEDAGRPSKQRVIWTDSEDSDAPYQKFKNRKKVLAKKARDETKRLKTRSKSAMVGRQPKQLVPVKRQRNYGSSDDENELMEYTLPDYLRQRRKSWDARINLNLLGLRIPPAYDADFFKGTGLENLRTLAEKPELPLIEPPAPYEDIELPASNGVIPAPIAQYLKPYQVEGAAWLHEKFVFQKGCLLGDDMGLGKTIQVISFLTAAFGKTGDERDDRRMRKMRREKPKEWYPTVLIICPGSLMHNWQNELDRWGWWKTYMYHGGAADKEAALAAAEHGRLEIMITTYDTYRLNESAINNIRWDCVIADECHQIKERKAEITKSMANVNALCRIGLSGTAIQNKYEELWTLLNWANPGCVGPITSWKQSICVPLKIGQSHDATVSQLSKARRIATKLVENLLPNFFLRRTKALIAHQLPKKSDRVVFCPLTETQADAYNNFCDSELVHAIRDHAKDCYCGSGKKQGSCCRVEVDGVKWQTYVFSALDTVKKLANHIALLIPTGEADAIRHEREMRRFQVAFPDSWEDLYAKRDSIIMQSDAEYCGKWKVLKRLLNLWHNNGDKVLIFSHSVRLLKILLRLFQGSDYKYLYLDGQTSYEDRQTAVDNYNSDPSQFVFLISTKAGGVGLNITSANKVVVVDPNWNPSYDLQAQDRAYRIGQLRDVEVFRLISAGTVEEIVYARQIYKQQQANIGYNASVERRYFSGVQDDKDHKGEIFGLLNIFAPQSSNVVLRDIVNKTNIAETKAGVQIAGLDLEVIGENDEDGFGLLDNNNEHDAMNHLAAEILDEAGARRKAAKESAKRKDPVQAILLAAGVAYSHENAEVVGSSRVEQQISSRAQKAGEATEWMDQAAFGRSSQLDPPLRDTHGRTGVGGEAGHDEQVRYVYRPPEDVRRRQFVTMAKGFGYDDVAEFALVVEGWTQAERRDCLEKFYARRKEMLLTE
jgi:SNF2 family DNA or RNA helicase